MLFNSIDLSSGCGMTEGDGLLNGEIFDSIFEARTLIEQWRKDYNTIGPHSSLGYKPPAPVTRHENLDKGCEKSLSDL